MTRRVILLIAALLVATVGTSMVFLYVRSADARAREGQEPVQVLVAKTAIAAGTTGAAAEQAGSFELKTLNAEAVAEGALSSTEPIRSLVALGPIFPGEQILQGKFGDPGSNATLPIPEGKLAMSVQLGDPARVAGFVGPGSEVAIFVTMQDPTQDEAELQQFTRILLPRVQVIAAGQTTVVTQTTTDTEGQEVTEQLPRAILTLAVTQAEAQKIVLAQSQGQLYFGLLTDKSQTAPGAPTNFENLFR